MLVMRKHCYEWRKVTNSFQIWWAFLLSIQIWLDSLSHHCQVAVLHRVHNSTIVVDPKKRYKQGVTNLIMHDLL